MFGLWCLSTPLTLVVLSATLSLLIAYKSTPAKAVLSTTHPAFICLKSQTSNHKDCAKRFATREKASIIGTLAPLCTSIPSHSREIPK